MTHYCTVFILVQDQNSNLKKTDQFRKESFFRLSYNSFNIICNSLEFMCECMYSVYIVKTQKGSCLASHQLLRIK